MQIVRNLEKKTYQNPVITIGSFDGVHLGHQQIFRTLKAKAKEVNGESIALTFAPHPRQLLHPDSDFILLTATEEKIALIADQGIDHLYVIPFTSEFASITFFHFFQEILKKQIGVKAIIMGPNHSFGKNREGNAESIISLCQRENVEAIIEPELLIDGAPVRSQRIRDLIRQGDYDNASKLLGRSVVLR